LVRRDLGEIDGIYEEVGGKPDAPESVSSSVDVCRVSGFDLVLMTRLKSWRSPDLCAIYIVERSKLSQKGAAIG